MTLYDMNVKKKDKQIKNSYESDCSPIYCITLIANSIFFLN